MYRLSGVARQAELPHLPQPLQQALHARGACGMRNGPQPCQSGPAESAVLLEKPGQRLLLPCVERVVDGLGRQAPGPRAAGQADAFQGDRAREHETTSSQLRRQTVQDGGAVVRVEGGVRRDVDRRTHVLDPCEGTQSKVPHRELPVLGSGRSPGGVVGDAPARHTGLLGQPGDQSCRRLEAVGPALAGVAQQRQVDRQTEPVARPASRRDQIEVLVRQNVVALEGGNVRVDPQQAVASSRRDKTT